MKGERKLRLVKGGAESPPPAPPGDDEPPFTEEELAAAAALRESLDHGEDPLALGLRGAYAPTALAEADLDAIVSRAFGDESATTGTERAAAERLRAELDGAAPLGEGAQLLLALKLAAHPTAIPPARNEALIQAALRRASTRARGLLARRIAPVTMAALAGVATLAAGVALLLDHTQTTSPADGAAAALVRARSADDLFEAGTPFPRRGGESARVDRIASAREADLRRNRFAAWGVR